MYLYSLGYGTCEESRYFILQHEKQFTQLEMDAVFEDAVFAGLCASVTEHNDPSDDDHAHTWMVRFQDAIDEDAFLGHLKILGFSGVKYAAQCDVFGWASAIDPQDWSEHRGEADKQLAARMMVRFDAWCKKQGMSASRFLDKES